MSSKETQFYEELHPPYDQKQAFIESNRCIYCYDAPCITACPTDIDIPGFIRKIATGNPNGAAKEIFNQNIMGATCARVCPVETLCQDACVRNHPDDQVIEIGLLQRFATDTFEKTKQPHPFSRSTSTGKNIAVIGAGPSGLAFAHRMSRYGHDITVLESKSKPGGLNEYGLAPYKVVNNSVQKEINFILELGGIEVFYDKHLGRDFTLDELRKNYDGVFLGMGLMGVNALGVENESMPGVRNAVDAIAEIRQSENLSDLKVGRHVVVIGGGSTAIDIAIQSKRLGAEHVTLVYRKSFKDMKATSYEQKTAQKEGVILVPWAIPSHLVANDTGHVSEIKFEYTTVDSSGMLKGKNEFFTLQADTVHKAIGQVLVRSPLEGNQALLDLSQGRIAVDENRKTSLPNVYAGGDCIPGNNLTVTAVQDGKIAAEAMHRELNRRGC
jgi:dihydropyrimidine dehydrogenase (NAD+) subunit PreT